MFRNKKIIMMVLLLFVGIMTLQYAQAEGDQIKVDFDIFRYTLESSSNDSSSTSTSGELPSAYTLSLQIKRDDVILYEHEMTKFSIGDADSQSAKPMNITVDISELDYHYEKSWLLNKTYQLKYKAVLSMDNPNIMIPIPDSEGESAGYHRPLNIEGDYEGEIRNQIKGWCSKQKAEQIGLDMVVDKIQIHIYNHVDKLIKDEEDEKK
ncbi:MULTISPECIES: hypothetical protein [unclassified Fusibacter]|uniref:hypothetical protein n=1 Tax=unclassified Fusibacter TaxID=2624464 RepID=UPI0010115A1D|nr:MULTISPECIES: hypothetical protein [unclassified Fusibacter]MCK8060812.1 hypothetical protein [Fusibacter sp. A2]NPE23108.1 hypothetical protein [Fusibacter sp. A1]RXV59779.1 hypothetical protein DWB64_14845 [Fusibacter sp. A1]